MEDATLYTADALRAVKLQLTSTDPDRISRFSPAFMYPLVGENETIYGYRSLAVRLHFASGSLKNYLGIEYEGDPLAGGKALDIEKTFYEFIPSDYTKDQDTFNLTVEKDEVSFKPLGTKIGDYARRRRVKPTGDAGKNSKGKGKAAAKQAAWEDCSPEDEDAVVFEAYSTRFDTPGWKDYHRRMQIFVLFFIEGGSYIDEEDDRWEFVTLYEKRKSAIEGQYSYHFVGYTSLYEFFYWPDKTRLRLAQFVILPPYQGAGHGSRFYSLVYLNLLNRPNIAELTIEDPSEAFQDMRDKADYRTLISGAVFKGIKAPLKDAKWVDQTRKEWKLATRQFGRLLELALRKELLTAKRKGKDDEKNYRLLVKERLHRQNYEILAPMERREKRETLQQTYESVIDEYDRILEQMGEI